MKITRRGSIMAMIGGLFAPTAAGRITNVKFPPAPINYYGGEVKADTPNANPFWRQERIAELQKVANGEFHEYQKDELNNHEKYYSPNEALINNLKSVSAVHKARMVHEAHIERQKKAWKWEALRTIQQLMSGK